MKVGVRDSGVSSVASAPSRYQAQSMGLSLTGRRNCESKEVVIQLVTVDDIDGDMFRFRIVVEGCGVEEYYEYDEPHSTAYVAQDWLSDVRESWGDAFADALEGDVQAEKLWETQETQNEDSEDSPIPLPPAPLEDKE